MRPFKQKNCIKLLGEACYTAAEGRQQGCKNYMAHLLLVFCPSLFSHFVANEIVNSNCWTFTFSGLRHSSIGIKGSSYGYISNGRSVKKSCTGFYNHLKKKFFNKGKSMNCTIKSLDAGNCMAINENNTVKKLAERHKQAFHYFLDKGHET